MNIANFIAHKELHRDMLVNKVMPFWERYAVDTKYGGIYTGLDRKGNIIETDKSVWFQGRAGWIFSTLYHSIDKKAVWADIAKSCIDFIEKHCFDADGKMFFRVTNDGKPVIRRERYIFSETFAIIAYASYAKLSGSFYYIDRARAILANIYKLVDSDFLVPKFNPKQRKMRGLGYHMIMLNTLQELRAYDEERADEYTATINAHIEEMKVFVKDDIQAVLEVVDAQGNFMHEHIEGRVINPGHDIEAGWFLLKEGMFQKRDDIATLGLKIIDYAWQWGWDKQYGGMVYFCDALNKPVSEYWHDMKFWWPHNEAVIAHLMAYQYTGEKKHWDNYEKVLNWAHEHFVDEVHGEWFGYLHRDGTLSTELKGNMYKGPFHVPRMYIESTAILQNLLSTKSRR